MSDAKKIKMKLLIDKNKNKVLFGEAGKETVDFLFHILSLPLGTVVKYLTKSSMVGSLGSLYGSFESLGIDYVQEGLNKDCLLNPKPAAGSASNVPLLTVAPHDSPDPNSAFYTCPRVVSNSYTYGHSYVSDGQGASCPSCTGQLNQALKYVAPPHIVGGYVKGVVTYMLMDDLSVQPMSTISGITLLNKFKVHDVGCLDEKEVTLDMYLGLALLKASMMSKTVLTDVFLGKKSGGSK